MPPDRESRIATAMLTCVAACFAIADVAHADGTGYFTSDQVTQGRLAYASDCATCHGASLQGGGAPALTGRGFALEWSGKTLENLYGFVHTQMPLGRAGALRDQTYADIVSYVLSENGIAPGDERLTPKTPMQRALALGASTGKGAVAATPPTKFVMGALTGEVRQPTTHAPTQAELDRADDATDSWLMYNKGYRGARYSTLAHIDTKNVGAIKPVCLFQTGELGTFSTRGP
jgi:mono/diheme cytochrome c family protein